MKSKDVNLVSSARGAHSFKKLLAKLEDIYFFFFFLISLSFFSPLPALRELDATWDIVGPLPDCASDAFNRVHAKWWTAWGSSQPRDCCWRWPGRCQLLRIQTCRRAPDLPGSTLPSQQACRMSNPGPGMASHFMVLSLSPEPHSHLHRKRQGSPGPWGAGDGSQGAVAPQNAWAGGMGREERERARKQI